MNLNCLLKIQELELIKHSIFLDNAQTDYNKTISNLIYEKATTLLLQGLQTHLFDYGQNDTILNGSIPLIIARNVDRNSDDNTVDNERVDDTIPDETNYNTDDSTIDIDENEHADIDFNIYLFDMDAKNFTSLYFDRKLNKSAITLSETESNTKYVPLPIPESPLIHSIRNRTHLNHHHDNDQNLVNQFFNSQHLNNGRFSNPISIDSQKGSSERSNDFNIDVRFDSADEQIATSTHRQIIDQQDSASQKFQYSAQAYHYTSIENRPPVSYTVPHPPLQDEYPKAIQNNYAPKARIAYQTSAQQYAPLSYSVPIPSSLPTIVHKPDSVPIQNGPSSLPASRPQYYSAPVITSTYSNQDSYAQSQNNVREKVVVKIVPATGWYLNDDKERQSYFNAVSQGLLNENGYVFVNDVQRIPSQTSPCESSNSQVPCNKENGNSITLPQYSPQQVVSSQPWLQRYGSPLPPLNQLPTPRQISPEPRSAREDYEYKGKDSYNVPLLSVGKLAGDSDRINNYSLSSLHGGSISSSQSHQRLITERYGSRTTG